jgi:hypothetical protein
LYGTNAKEGLKMAWAYHKIALRMEIFAILLGRGTK